MPKHPEVKIKRYPSKAWKCKKCGNYIVYWYTKYGEIVYECEKCGWASKWMEAVEE